MTARERQVLRLVVDGQTNREIARSLVVTQETVNTYVKRLYKKTGTHSRAELIGRLFREKRVPVQGGGSCSILLSMRELQVVSQLSQGRSNAEIGEALGIEEATVKSHLSRIARKLGTGRRGGMVTAAYRGGVLR